MTMDSALARFPECPACNQGVDENDSSTPHVIIDREYYHAKCVVEEGIEDPWGLEEPDTPEEIAEDVRGWNP